MREVLRAPFTLAGLPFEAVERLEELLAGAAQSRRSGDRHLLMLDCSHDAPDDLERCLAVVTRTRHDVYLVCPDERLVRAVTLVAGRPPGWLPSDLSLPLLLETWRVLDALVRVEATGTGRAGRAALTRRERLVAARLAAGQSDRVIAAELSLSVHTIKSHRRAIFRKLGVTTRAEVIASYRPEG